MSKREAVGRYNLIIRRLRRAPASYAELLDFLERESELQGYNFKLSRRTLRRDLDDILSLYNIQIAFDFKQGTYRIEDDNHSGAAARILEAYDMLHVLNLTDGLSKHILFESRKPRGTEHFYGLLHAIQNKLRTGFRYEKYWDDTIGDRSLEPYALKEFRGRWYVVGKDIARREIRTFGLDRISELIITSQHFIPDARFDAAKYFEHSFGIIAPANKAPVEVILSFLPEQGKYIKSYPLHHSQQVLKDDDDELRIALRLCLTYDFLMEIMAHNSLVRVIAPQQLAEQVKAAAVATASLYQV